MWRRKNSNYASLSREKQFEIRIPLVSPTPVLDTMGEIVFEMPAEIADCWKQPVVSDSDSGGHR